MLLIRTIWELTVPAVPASGPRLEPLRQVNSQDTVVLTFNITWGEKVPTAILEQLSAYNVGATFFVTGPWAVEHVNLIQKMVADGHDVGSLGHQVVNLSGLPPEEIKADIAASVEAIRSAGSPAPIFFRPPGGAYDQTVVSVASSLGLQTVLWNVDARDWLAPGVDVIISEITTATTPGSIILLHASDHNIQTMQAIKRIVEHLLHSGYKLSPLSAIIGTSGNDHPNSE